MAYCMQTLAELVYRMQTLIRELGEAIDACAFSSGLGHVGVWNTWKEGLDNSCNSTPPMPFRMRSSGLCVIEDQDMEGH